ncbi:MAG: LrgB family protein [Alysiella sp.]|uniref:LrgB family protein n=1 Tax=Alysiella sp. TaxID=1872483 RepID=UPI0026DA873F|nr:LrgB family protein [Alysiella sp.]MDO4433397.1 LrgB family protein [Alysiella sp.]
MNEWTSVFNSPYWLLFLLFFLFQFSLWLKKRLNLALINPTLITTVGLIAYLLASNTPYEKFNDASRYITFWLQPAVVCLAVPLYVQWQKIKSQWLAIMVSQIVGCVVGIASGVLLALWLGGSQQAALSVAAKSVTMPIAIEVTRNIGGVVGINSATVLIAGVLGQIVGLAFFALTQIKSPMAQGVAMGTASHALGIASIMHFGARYVAYGTVGLIVNGILTAFIAPLLVPVLMKMAI